MKQHITLIAALNIGFGVIRLLIGIGILIILSTAGLISGDANAAAITTLIGTIIAIFFSIKSVPEILGGIGLLKRKQWARITIMIVGCIDIIEFPIGTAIGIYTLWVLLNEETVAIFNHEEVEHG
jgi:hypothetical protein